MAEFAKNLYGLFPLPYSRRAFNFLFHTSHIVTPRPAEPDVYAMMKR